MDPRILKSNRTEIDQRRRTITATWFLAGCSTLASLACALFLRQAVGPLVLGSLVLVLAAAAARDSYTDAVEKLAIEAGASAIPDVQLYLTKVANTPNRRLMADWICELLMEAGRPGSLYLADRVAAHDHQLRLLASDLVSNVTIQPASMALCARLLTAAPESPIYNPRIPSEQLMAALFRIRLGIGGRT